MSKIKIRLFLIAFIFPLNILFTNCSPPAAGALILQSTNLSSEADLQFLAGKNSYTTNCAVCHGDISNSTKLGRSADMISAAIATQPQMKFLSGLSATELSQISYALGAVQSQPGIATPSTTQYQALTTNRFMMKSNLSEIFISDSATDASDLAIMVSIDSLINDHPEAFGGNCARNDTGCIASCGPSGDANCVGLYDTITNASPTPVVNAVTQGYLVQVCEQILSVDKATQTALSKAGINSLVAPNSNDVTTVMRFFFRDKPVDMASVNALIQVGDQARLKSYSVLDQWRFLLLPLCISGANQML